MPVFGTPRDTQLILWDGVVFEKVGSVEEAGLPPLDTSFPLDRRSVSINVKRLSPERAAQLRKGRS